MTQRGVIPDFRPPHGLRLGFAPLYNTFADIVRGVEAIKEGLAAQGDAEEPLGPVT
jgi:kynureninase